MPRAWRAHWTHSKHLFDSTNACILYVALLSTHGPQDFGRTLISLILHLWVSPVLQKQSHNLWGAFVPQRITKGWLCFVIKEWETCCIRFIDQDLTHLLLRVCAERHHEGRQARHEAWCWRWRRRISAIGCNAGRHGRSSINKSHSLGSHWRSSVRMSRLPRRPWRSSVRASCLILDEVPNGSIAYLFRTAWLHSKR